ncbi:hypothetical protein T440DRAFT_473866 [Plenodomus tracheiphilus IPT5]|uniref:Uncharacterized protein n=1 Tax=Plenodomus tracheiphilus IPT5 TaxID=1408161 RepID=A0A6A7ANE7_9PLEO|nr:hypothetical protein T440DRAFT_473866 [Plenodomus tracheiphilus IPT5]
MSSSSEGAISLSTLSFPTGFVSSIEDLDALSEDMIQVEQVRADNFVGKCCGSQCLWCLQRQVVYPKQYCLHLKVP